MEKSFIFNSINGDRKYKAEDFTNYFSKFITNGVFPNVGSNLQVLADGTNMSVKLKAGAAWINGRMYENTDDLTLPIQVADGTLNRIDRIVIQLNYANREIIAKVKKGTFASSPVAPAVQRDADIYELAIADISVNKGITSVTQVLVTDLRLNTSVCGIVNSLLQADTTSIFNQFQDWFNTTKLSSELDIDVFIQEMQQDFITWFESIKGQLSGDIAGNLQNQISEHKADYVKHPGIATTTNTGNAYSITLNPAPTAYVDKMCVVVTINASSTGASTINVNSLGARGVKNDDGTDFTEFKKDGIYTLRYNAATGNFILQGKGGGLTATDKTSLINAVNALEAESNTFLAEGLNLIRSAILAKGGTVPSNPTMTDIQTTIGNVASWDVKSWDPDLIAKNIKMDVNIFGVIGTLDALFLAAGDTEVLYNGTKQYTTSSSTAAMTKYVEVRMLLDGTIRCSMDLLIGGSSGESMANCKGYICVNGTVIQQQSATSAWTTYTYDIPVKKNDLVQFWGTSAWLPGAQIYMPTQIKNCKIKVIATPKHALVLE